MRAAMLLLVMMLTTVTAWAAERTVTYTFHQESSSGNIMTYAFTRSGNSFGYKTGVKTATVYDYQHTTGFTVELDDDIHLQLKMNESQLTTAVYDNLTGIILKGDYNPSLIVTSGHYYITHIKMADFELTITYADAPRPYAISFNEVEGLTNPNPATYSMTTNTFNIVAPTRTGYDIGAVTYTDALHPNPTAAVLPMNIVRGDAATRKDISFNAAWTAHHYSVSYNANGGSGEMDDQDFTYGVSQQLSANSFTAPTGYHFTGWNTAADGSGTGYDDVQSVQNLTSENNATVTLYAQWAAGVEVTYIDAEGTEQNVMAIPIDGSKTDYGISRTTNWYVVSGEVNLDHLHFYNDFTHLILADGARLTANSSTENTVQSHYLYIYGQSGGTGQLVAFSENNYGIGTGDRDLIINGGSVTATGGKTGIDCGIITINGGSVTATGGENHHGIDASNFTINGGNLTATATGENGHGIYATGNGITINGGNVTATGGKNGHGIYATGSGITLAGGTVWASSYSGAVKTPSYNDYYTDGTSIYYFTLNDEQKKNIAGKTMQPALRLKDNGNNNTAISKHDGETIAVALYNRTLYKDGDWNTLTLPFDLGDEEAARGSEFDGTPLEGATVKALANSENSGTGYDASTGTLTLYFVDANKIEAGVPYLVKWDKAADYDDNPTDYDIVSPVFLDITVSNEDPAERKVISYDHNVEFRGNYSPASFTANDKSILFLGAENKLYWPNADMTLNAFRGHFVLSDGSGVREVKLNFEDNETTGVRLIDNGQLTIDNDGWYTVSGVRLSGKPTQRGMYIHGGKAVVIKK